MHKLPRPRAPCTLTAMATAHKPDSSPHDRSTDDAHDPFAWDPDPVVLVSRRARRLLFPRLLVERALTADEVATARPDLWVIAQAGVTFLGTLSTSWADLATMPGHASTVPDMRRAVLAQPASWAQQAISAPGAGNKDPATGRLRPDRVREIFRRVFAYVKDTRHPTSPDLWTTVDGYDAPEMMMLPLSEVFSQRTERGQQAHEAVFKTIPVLRRVVHETVTPLGVLHDYAVRARGGGASAILSACRAKAAKWKVG